jgi:hypothetical protein
MRQFSGLPFLELEVAAMNRTMCFAALVFLAAVSMFAQEYRGTITGIITDGSGSAVPGAKVQLTNTQTSAVYNTQSSASGAYSFNLLEPGTYRLRAEAQGFKPVAVSGLEVHTAEKAGLNLQMEIGDVSQTIQVTAETPLLNTQSADAGTVIDNARIDELPMLGRSPFILARISPGVLVAGQINETKPYDVAGQSFVSIGGGRRYNTEFQINGMPNVLPVGYFSGRVAYTPPADGTQEFQVITNPFDAQYGSSGNGVISVTTKSGANRYHGSLYEFFQNDKLNATNFYVNSVGGAKPPRRYNQFGGSVGGPVDIPKLFQGKNKLFYFFAYEGIRNASPNAAFATVPTEKMRNGDFSELLTRNPGVTIFNPFALNGNQRAAFPNNQIPANLISPVAKNVLSYIPLPNVAGAGLENNYFSSTGTYDVFNNYLGRLDYLMSDKHRMFFNIGEYSTNNRIADLFHTLATGGVTQGPKQIINFNDTYTWSPTLLMDVRLGYSGYAGDTVPKSTGIDITTLGFPSAFAAQTAQGAFPRFDFVNYTGFGVGGTATTHTVEHAHTYFLSTSLTKIKGSHNLRFGFEAREKQDYSLSYGNSSGSYLFNGQYTTQTLNGGPGFGNDLASFMLGLSSPNTTAGANTGTVDLNSPAGLRGRYYAWFFQDDWKVTPNLTLNLGVRYDLESPTYELHDRIVAGWLWGKSNPIEAAAQANYAKNPDPVLSPSEFKVPGGDLFAGTNGLPDGVWDWNKGDIMPRLGLAWNPNFAKRRLVFRAGWGLTYYSLSPSGTGTWQYGFSQSTPFVSTADNGATFISTLGNPYPNGVSQPVGNSLGPLTNLGLGNDAITRKQLQPYNNHYMAALQYQFTKSDVVEANYNGSVVVHTPGTNYPVNFIPAQYMGTSYTRDTSAINYLSATVANPFFGIIPANTPLGQKTITRAQLLMPYPEFGTVLRRGDNSGSITNQEVYFSWQHRTSHGFTVLTNYLISKQMWARDRKNPQDTQFERRPGSEDRPRQFTLAATYDLPVGRGKAFGSGVGAVADRLIGGWQVSGIYTAQSGPVLNWGAVVFTGNKWSDIVNVPGGQNIQHWINTSVFDTKAADQPNTAYQFRYFPVAVPDARAPGVNNVDLSLNKRVRITEALNLQIRADAFDALNHPNWGSPNVSPTSAAFGRITSQANLPRTIQLGMRLSF